MDFQLFLMVALETVSFAFEAKNQNSLDQSEAAEDLLLFCALSADQEVTPVTLPADAITAAKMSQC